MYFRRRLSRWTKGHRRYRARGKLIEVDAADAEQFCCNALDLNRRVF